MPYCRELSEGKKGEKARNFPRTNIMDRYCLRRDISQELTSWIDTVSEKKLCVCVGGGGGGVNLKMKKKKKKKIGGFVMQKKTCPVSCFLLFFPSTK